MLDPDGTWLAVAVLPAPSRERDTLSALDVVRQNALRGQSTNFQPTQASATQPSLRRAVLDGDLFAERSQDCSIGNVVRHHVVERDADQKSLVVPERR